MDLFQWLTDTTEGKCLFTTLVSMIPIIELRGGIPFGVAQSASRWSRSSEGVETLCSETMDSFLRVHRNTARRACLLVSFTHSYYIPRL